MRTLILLLFLTCPMLGANWNTVWKVSTVALLTTNMLDCHSSYQHPELNPLLRSANGNFSDRGVAIKAGVIVGLLVTQRLAMRKYPKAAKPFAISNLAASAAFAYVAKRNYSLDKD